MASTPILLHTSPPLSSLPASDPESLYLAGLLQLACPGRWATVQGDWGSEGGRLPSISHLSHQLPTRHLSSLPAYQDPDSHLSAAEQADCLIWKAYIEQTLTDLVNHTLYSLPPNYPLLSKAQISTMVFPQSHYIPQRLRSIVKTRLQHVGFWGLGGLHDGDAVEEDKKKLEDAFIIGPAGTAAPRAWSGWRAGKVAEDRKRKYGEDEIVKRAKGVLDPLARRLGDSAFFLGHKPTTLDLRLFSHLTLLLTPDFSNPLLSNLINDEYPTLRTHHNRLLGVLFLGLGWSSVPRAPSPPRPSWTEALSSWWGSSAVKEAEKPETRKQKSKSKTKLDKDFDRGRLLWFVGAATAMASYLFVSGLVQIQMVKDGDDEEGEYEEIVIEVEDEEEDD